ncbi:MULTISPECIES: gas vesicle protein [unclassified Streptomyces]|uniref:gas vesicle protein n=1 Tax=unclassified Streptomyces TaxID=2593676 RepID=UPI001BEB0F26|nr:MULTISPECIES: gas vesicle protein [unclassified Streptomyces]MBT2405254.1 gas vesicle protein [Streptomyces sp. ISL-21]MBT2611022.1 gas vesicle protein [Streptomyces sp. ISL-87]
MTDPLANRLGPLPSRATPMSYPPTSSASLADILERVLDKGIVIAGDIRINLLDIELLTIKLRILIASVDKAKEMGIDWWEYDPSLSSRHSGDPLAEENRRLRSELEALRRGRLEATPSKRADESLAGESEPRPRATKRNRPAP